jgi:hypothetical protein
LKVSFFWCSNWFKLIQTSHWWARARAGTPRRPSPWKVTQPLLRVSGHGKAEPSFIAEFRICLDHPRPSARRIREPFAACNFDFSFLMHFRQQVKWALLWSRILQGKWTLQLFEPLMISVWAWLPFRSCCHMLPVSGFLTTTSTLYPTLLRPTSMVWKWSMWIRTRVPWPAHPLVDATIPWQCEIPWFSHRDTVPRFSLLA